MVYSFLFLIFFILCLLCFYTKEHKSTIQFKRKYNIQTNMSSVNIIAHIIVYTLGIIDISICVWALFNI